VRDTLPIPVAGLPAGDYHLELRLLGWNDAPLPTKPLPLTTVTWGTPPPVPKIALWQAGRVVNGENPVYRYRSTIAVTRADPTTALTLTGPDGVRRQPLAEDGYLSIFMVDYDWPGGAYHLEVNGEENGLLLRVENFGWEFAPPAAMTYPVAANFDGKIELLGYDLPTRRVEAGGGLPLLLYWRGLAQVRDDYTIFVQLLDADLERRGGYDRFPRENYNTFLWVPGEVVADGFAVPVNADAPPGVYTVRIGFYRAGPTGGVAETLRLVPGGETSVVIGPLKVGGPPPGLTVAQAAPQHSADATFGEVITLQGYDLVREGAALHVTLYWRSVGVTDVDYTVFVHLRDEAGQVVAQMDRPPVAGQYPTSLWDAGEIIPDSLTLTLPPSDSYHLLVGLYDLRTGARLPVPGSAEGAVRLAVP
jgi:hypothetical protein